MAPYRWIELCIAFEKQHPNDSGAKLRPRTTKIIDDSLATADNPELFIVPGGRYMDRIVFRLWNYRVNSSESFSADVDVKRFKYNLEQSSSYVKKKY